MTGKIVYVIYNWDGPEPKAVSAWSSREKTDEELLKLQTDSPNSTFYSMPADLS